MKNIFRYKWRWFFNLSFLSNDSTSNIEIGRNVKIQKAHISVNNGSKVVIHNNVTIENVNIVVNGGTLEIGENTILTRGNNELNPSIIIDCGSVVIGMYNTIKSRIWIRFGGVLNIGNYNAINEKTEIRSDEKVDIGDFNMISYECMIYDTNTHCFYSTDKRRKMTRDDFPIMGMEYEKPITKPLRIGNDCWLGKRAVLLKGTVLEDEVVVGACSLVAGKIVEKQAFALGNPASLKSKKL